MSPVSPGQTRPSPPVPEDRELLHRPVLGLVVVAALAVVLVVAFVGLPREGATLPAIARQALLAALPQWKTTEVVSEIVYGTRGADTFGETFLLLAAVVSVTVLTRHPEPRRGFVGESAAGRAEQRDQDPHPAPPGEEQAAREAEDDEGEGGDQDLTATPDAEAAGRPAPERAEAMTVVVRVAVRVVAPVLAVAGCYLVAQGYSPGGGFPAGLVILGVVLLLWTAFGYRRIARGVAPETVEPVELLFALVIVAVEVLGLVLRGSFSANWIHLGAVQTYLSGGVLQAFSVAEFVEVGTGLVLVVFAVLGMRHDWTPDEDDES